MLIYLFSISTTIVLVLLLVIVSLWVSVWRWVAANQSVITMTIRVSVSAKSE